MKNLILPLFMGLLCILSCQSPSKNSPPNILIIMADDLGYGDLGCYNSQSLVPTPNLDRLASEGIRFTRAYCPVSVCSPSRYALMTGRYPWRSWKKSGVMANYEPSMIGPEILTLPAMLQQSGYSTAGFGKWHLGATFPTLDGQQPAGYGKFRADDNGANLDLSKPVSDGPVAYGFDRWYGFSCASECWILEEDTITGAIGHDLYTIEATPNKDHIEVVPLDQYLPHITDKSIQFLKKQASVPNPKPFFLYFAPYVPHIPLAVSEPFRGTTEAGLYGDYVHELDHYAGHLLHTLDSLGLQENTIVLFASDNGSQFERTSNDQDMSQASNNPDERIPHTDSIKGHYPNHPLRGTKWSIYEGGVRTLFIARWPGHFPAGQVHTALMGLNDVISTLATVTQYDVGQETQLDSYNMLSVWEGTHQGQREEIVVQSSGKRYGIISGKWKYIPPSGNQATTEPGELYDLASDPSETHNIHEENPEIVRNLKERLQKILGDEVSFGT